MKASLTEARHDLDISLQEITLRMQDHETALVELRAQASGIEGEIRGIDRALALLGSDAAPEPQPKQRQAVQRVVMALFGPERGSWDEAGIVEKTGLPRLTVRDFLGRAVRTGKLRRDGGIYSLPAAQEQREAAE